MSETDQLMNNLASQDPSVKKSAMFSIGEKKLKEAIPKLIDLLLTDQDSVVRNSAARAIGKIGDKTQFDIIFEAFEKALNDEDAYVKANVCWALGKFKDIRAIPLLMKMVDPAQRLYSMVGELKDMKSTKETDASTKLREEGIKFSDVIVSAVKALGDIKDPAAIPALVKALGDEDDGTVRCAAAVALGKIKNPLAIQPLVDRLKIDKYWYVRRDICQALVKYKNPDIVEDLVKFTNDMYDEVREYALKAILSAGKPAAGTIFKLYLKNPKNEELKNYITTQLSKEDIIASLESLILNEENPAKKEVYTEYLSKMQSSE